ncbi:hypothetical protein [uncultured Clostridium sp.]|uniref:hypothetical protein n=1 Tax=uncultured Clostridium sp. TaxID=59620 RepID=UPI00258FCFD7|nr:hypothetical protein [uncultured Clostridium sp.]MDU1351051.1 hypothetical protein [Clostridium argentinense]
MSFRTVYVNGYGLSVEFVPGVIRIKNDTTLKNMLKGTSNGSGIAAYILKEEYYKTFKKPIDISTNSLAVEILGHVYPDKVAQAVRNIPLISHLADKMISHTSVIDCGENDSERWLWGALAPFHELIGGTIAG